MKATTKNEATKEGKNFARLLGSLVVKQASPEFENVADFAQILAVDLFGYSGAELANAWTKGFIGQWTTADPSYDPDALNVNTVELLRKALGLPPLLSEKNGE